MSLFNSLIEWTNKIFLPLGPYGLFILSFIESSFFPIPPDILLIPLALASPDKALWFALIATTGSVLGGMFGYLIGYVGEKAVLERFFAKNKIERVHNLMNKYEAWGVFAAALTPIPYKLATIAAGVFYVDFKKFVLASILGRGLRFFAEAILIMIYGKLMLEILEKYFEWISLFGVLSLIIIYIIYKKYRKNK